MKPFISRTLDPDPPSLDALAPGIDSRQDGIAFNDDGPATTPDMALETGFSEEDALEVPPLWANREGMPTFINTSFQKPTYESTSAAHSDEMIFDDSSGGTVVAASLTGGAASPEKLTLNSFSDETSLVNLDKGILEHSHNFFEGLRNGVIVASVHALKDPLEGSFGQGFLLVFYMGIILVCLATGFSAWARTGG